MSSSTSFKPAGYHSVTPYLVVRDARRAIEFYQRAFDAKEKLRLEMPDGKLGHAEIVIGDSTIMLADENPEWGAVSPETIGGTGSSLMVYVEDCDAVFKRALDAGATELMPVADQFYGDRSGTLKDPFGHKWNISTNKETLTPEELNQRFAALLSQPQQ
jgi:PhnB protein